MPAAEGPSPPPTPRRPSGGHVPAVPPRARAWRRVRRAGRCRASTSRAEAYPRPAPRGNPAARLSCNRPLTLPRVPLMLRSRTPRTFPPPPLAPAGGVDAERVADGQVGEYPSGLLGGEPRIRFPERYVQPADGCYLAPKERREAV